MIRVLLLFQRTRSDRALQLEPDPNINAWLVTWIHSVPFDLWDPIVKSFALIFKGFVLRMKIGTNFKIFDIFEDFFKSLLQRGYKFEVLVCLYVAGLINSLTKKEL